MGVSGSLPDLPDSTQGPRGGSEDVTVLVRSVSVRMRRLTDGLSSAEATKFQYATAVVKPGGVKVVYWKLCTGGKLRVAPGQGHRHLRLGLSVFET